MGEPMSIYDHDYSLISRNLSVSSVMSIHKYFDLVYSFKIVNGLLLSPELQDYFRRRDLAYSLRESRQSRFLEGHSRTNFHFFSAGCRLVRSWNDLPLELQECVDLGSFKFLAKGWAMCSYV